jgi:predicted naringenin-chalcone synthase
MVCEAIFFGGCAAVFVGGDEENDKENDKKKKIAVMEKWIENIFTKLFV